MEQDENKNLKLISVGDLFKKSWQIFKKGFWKLLGIFGIGLGINAGLVILMIIIIAISIFAGIIPISQIQKIIPSEMDMSLPASASAVWSLAGALSQFFIPLIAGLVLFLAFLIANYWISASALAMAININKDIKIKQALKQGWEKLASYVWVGLLSCLIIFGGSLLLIIPGLIFAVWFSFAVYALMRDNIQGWEALKRSKELVSGYFWPVTGRIIILQLIIISATIILNLIAPGLGGILGIFASLFGLVYHYIIYQDLKRVKNTA
tara:strand:+ start:539 stop:1336 length:798 start_codon:yes stop_codon:yes gene_type:complete